RQGRPAERDRPRWRERMTRILLVEDEPDLADPLAYLLRREGFEVEISEDGPGALEAFRERGADIILLDLMLPGMPGTEVCRQVRQSSAVPIIMLTAKDSEVDIVVGLELGADDYVTKPYSSRELLARIRAVLRRRRDVDGGDHGIVEAGGVRMETERHSVAGRGEEAAMHRKEFELLARIRAVLRRRLDVDGDDHGIVEAGDVRMDTERHSVSVRGEEVAMPLKEFELLELLLRNAGRVLTRGQLIDRVWGSDYFGDTKTLDVHIKRIRSRIEEDPSAPRLLVTVRGLGYRFED